MHHSVTSGCKSNKNTTKVIFSFLLRQIWIACYHKFPLPNVMYVTICLSAKGHLYSNTKRTVGILDLGGGSTQITFLPKSKVN